MFGYIVANKPEMKIKDYDRYKEYYCGICHSLNKRHGKLCGLTLSYDSAFFAVLLTALYEPENIRKNSTCIIHPYKKHIQLENPYIDYVADMNLVLAYYKCMDDYYDDSNYAKLGYGNLIKSEVKKIKKKFPKKVQVIKEGIRELSYLETKKCNDIDRLSGVFGDIMKEITNISPDELCIDGYVYDNEEWCNHLGRIGYFVGKYIYILDAYDDIEKDIKSKNFNPFIERFKREEIFCSNANELEIIVDYEYLEDYVKKILMMTASEIASAFERLPIVKEVDILRNIIYSGIWTKFWNINKRRGKNERSL